MKLAKRIALAALIAVVAAGAAAARDQKQDRRQMPMWPPQMPGQQMPMWPMWQPGQAPQAPQSPVTLSITGPLQILNGRIALVDSQKTYYIAGLQRWIGFIDGLKEGATVTLDGSALAYPNTPDSFAFRVTKLTLNGKEYTDLGMFGRN